ncbi:Cna B-type domain-containing protein [Erysipelothrix sp. strain 2 (EsS2-7-Brazil)]|uniref:sortase-dependent adhesin RspA n=1 Tax=Erysipelothrix sp. strain 2 (EsS2-7-Brazil) TaxID=2500579 RepID=UPI00190DFA12|nr:Cna B-type domain-containing protein [Erysipelothrix sp. strain 2 (EsS2-7-Brazil)]MBK2403967.1 Cna B-type domain-containing protein [Erysipelothrix sp. strain 2 (EsS2-7-Brazil)]
MKRKLFALLMAVVMFVSTGVQLDADTARVANQNSLITDFNFSNTNLNHGYETSVTVQFAESGNRKLNSGDVMELRLPMEQKVDSNGSPYSVGLKGISQTIKLTMPGVEKPFGHVYVTESNVHVVFTDEVDQLNNIAGSFTFRVEGFNDNTQNIKETLYTNLGTNVSQKSVQIEGQFQGSGSYEMFAKLGGMSREEEEVVRWVLLLNGEREPFMSEMTVRDTIGTGHEYMPGSLVFMVTDHTGNRFTVSEQTFRDQYGGVWINGQSLIVATHPGKLHYTSIEVMYNTKITDLKQAEMENKAVASFYDHEGYPQTIEKDVSVENHYASGSIVGNKPKPGVLRIVKVIDGTETPVSGVTFTVKNDRGVLVERVTTDETGVVNLSLKDGRYTIEEVEAPSWLVLDPKPVTVDVDQHAEVGTLAVFKNEIKKTEVKVSKTWIGGPSPHPIVAFNLMQTLNGVTSEAGRILTLEGGKSSVVFENLPVADETGTPIVYSVEEAGFATDEYKVSITPINENNEIFVTNTFIKDTELTDFKVFKTWNGGPSTKPSVSVQLYANGDLVEGSIMEIPSGENSVTFQNLPAYKGGVAIEYSIREVEVPKNYKETVIKPNHIENEYLLKDVTMTKKWVGGSPIHPDTEYVLVADGVDTEHTVTLSQETSYTFKDMPKYNDKGQEIVYRVREVVVPEGYDASYSEDGLTITNTYRMEYMDVTANKVWVDSLNSGEHPTVRFQLYQTIDGVTSAVNGVYKDLSEGSVTFKQLPKTTQDGKEIRYTVREANIPKHYEVHYSTDGLTVTNTFKPDMISVNVEKVWNHGPVTRPDIEIQLYANGAPVTNGKRTLRNGQTHVVYRNLPKQDHAGEIVYTVKEITQLDNYSTRYEGAGTDLKIINDYQIPTKPIIARKVWEGGPSPKPTIALTLSKRIEGSNDILPVPLAPIELKDGETEAHFGVLPIKTLDGKTITYFANEVDVPEGYLGLNSYSDPLTVINRFDVKTAPVYGKKLWRGGPDLKPDIEIKLQERYEGETEYRDSDVASKLLKSGYDTVRFDSMPTFAFDGRRIEYRLHEVKVPTGYTQIESSNPLELINVYNQGSMSVTAEKKWIGGRKETVTLRLYQEIDGVETPVPNGERVLKESEAQIVTFTDLPERTLDGKTITYFVRELGVPENYSVSYSSDRLTVINTFQEGVTHLNVKKIWQGGPGPSIPLELELTRNGAATGIMQTMVPGDNDVVFANLPKYSEENVPYFYSVREVNEIEHYSLENISHDGDTNVTLTNVYDYGVRDVVAKKVWTNGMSPRPEIQFELRRASSPTDKVGTSTGRVQTLRDGETTTVFKDLEVRDDEGNTYIYFVKELTSVPNTITQYSPDGLTVYNHYVSPKTSIRILKTWVDGPTVRPDTSFQLTRRLKGTENVFEDVLGFEAQLHSGQTHLDFVDVPLNDHQGNPYEYSVREVSVPENYTETVSPIRDANIIEVTNTYQSPLKSVTAFKKWSGGEKARDRVVFELYRRVEDNDFEAVSNQKETLLPSMASVTFTDLPVNDQQGRLYEYRVKEIEGPEHFEASYSDDGLTVTNTYNPGVTEVSFTKVWVDGPDTHPTIVVDLYANNVKTEHAITLQAGEKAGIFKNLPKRDEAGIDITYTVQERDVPENYDVLYQGTTITNTFNQGVRDVIATKLWDGGPMTHSEVTFELFADQKATGITQVLSPGAKTVTFTNVPVYTSEGTKIAYRVEEISGPEHYIARYSSDGLTVTNTYDPGLRDVIATKKWVGGASSNRPTVIFDLYADGSKTDQSVSLSDGMTQAHFTNRPIRNQDGSIIQYTVKERTKHEAYDVHYSEDGLTVTNTFNPGSQTITAHKVWVGGPDEKPDVVFELYANNKPLGVKKILGSGVKSVSFRGQPVFDDFGKRIKYHIVEHDVPDYKITYSADGLTAINTYTKIDNGVGSLNNRPTKPSVPPLHGINVLGMSKNRLSALPNTGVGGSQMQYTAALGLIAMGLILRRKKRK